MSKAKVPTTKLNRQQSRKNNFFAVAAAALFFLFIYYSVIRNNCYQKNLFSLYNTMKKKTYFYSSWANTHNKFPFVHTCNVYVC